MLPAPGLVSTRAREDSTVVVEGLESPIVSCEVGLTFLGGNLALLIVRRYQPPLEAFNARFVFGSLHPRLSVERLGERGDFEVIIDGWTRTDILTLM